MRRLILFTLFIFLSIIRGGAQDELPYRDGESLTYVVNYKWGAVNTDVGEGTARVKISDGIVHAIVNGQTYKFYDMFFKVREYFESKFRVSDGRPLYFHRSTSEGKYSMVNNYSFDNKTYEIFARTKKKSHPEKDTILRGTANTFDLVSLFYRARSFNFNNMTLGVPQPISFAIDREIYNMSFTYYGDFIKKIQGLGTFRVMKFSVKLVAGKVFSGDDDLIVWVTADKNRIPVQFESPILVGKVYGRLARYSNLKYPISSKIK